jgi:hypothetical protein
MAKVKKSQVQFFSLIKKNRSSFVRWQFRNKKKDPTVLRVKISFFRLNISREQKIRPRSEKKTRFRSLVCTNSVTPERPKRYLKGIRKLEEGK